MTPELETLRRLHEAATPGPWGLAPNGLRDGLYSTEILSAVSVVAVARVAFNPLARPDAKLITTLRNLAPELLALWEAANHVSHDSSEQSVDYYNNVKAFNAALDALNTKAGSMDA